MKFITGCEICQKSKPVNHAPNGKMNSIPSFKLGQSISVDLLGPLTKSLNGHEYILVITDDFTRNVECYPLRGATAKACPEKLLDYCCRHGFPFKIRSDNGPQFVSTLWDHMCRLLERHVNWDQYLSALAFGIRTAVNEVTGYSAAKLTFGEELRSPLDPVNDENTGEPVNLEDRKIYDEFVTDLQIKLQEIVESAKTSSIAARDRQKDAYDKNRIPHNFSRTHILSDAESKVAKSLSKPLDGPIEIIVMITKNIAKLRDSVGKESMANVDQLKPFFSPPNWAKNVSREVDPLEKIEIETETFELDNLPDQNHNESCTHQLAVDGPTDA
ncbi:hypothetical protein B566_EDAN015958 [Ephemera danica]|nr:hypothetical protein B566_EDAN015958 [Ephemera danica]